MIKTLGKFVKQYKKVSILTSLCMAMEVTMEMIIPLLMSTVIDKGVEKGDFKYVITTGALMLFVALCSLSFGALSGVFGAKASTGFAKNLRKGMYDNIQNFSFAEIDKYSTAGLITRLTTDVTNVQQAYQMLLRMCIRSPFTFVCAMVMVLSIDARLGLIFIAAALILGFALFFIIGKVNPKFREVFKRYDDLNASVQENISGMRVVKAFVREKHETGKFTTATNKLKKMFVSAENLIILNTPIMQFVMYSCILLLSWLGAKMIVSGSLTTGELTAMFTYTSNILMSLMMISMIFVMLTMSLASGERISEVLNQESSIKNPENPVFEVKDGSVTFENVSFSYLSDPDKINLKNVNIDIKSGETIGIIGGTGSAKSAFVQLLPRLYDVMEGCVKVGGIDVKEYDMDTLRNNVAMVLQKNVLFSGSIKENLKWGKKDATDEEIIEACKLACADEFIEKLPQKYDTHIEQGGANVSGGQKQRLCIARALIKKPKILILDDSTSAVDTATDLKIRKAFKEYIPETTKFIIAQRISSIQDADRIIVLDNGKINGVGTHDELLENNTIYKEVYTTQMKGADL